LNISVLQQNKQLRKLSKQSSLKTSYVTISRPTAYTSEDAVEKIVDTWTVDELLSPAGKISAELKGLHPNGLSINSNYWGKDNVAFDNDTEPSIKKSLFDRARELNNQGVWLRTEGRLKESRKAYEEAVALYRELAATKPDEFLPYLASTLNNLGPLYRSEGMMAEALAAYEESLALRRQFSLNNPSHYLPDVAATLNNIGNIYRAQARVNEARKFYTEALTILTQLTPKTDEVDSFINSLKENLVKLDGAPSEAPAPL
jgi:tetratricopeptide (TPR) repeat protein